MLINLRGTHGSGKSTAICSLMEKSNVRPIFGTTFGLRCPEGYKLRLPEVKADVFVDLNAAMNASSTQGF